MTPQALPDPDQARETVQKWASEDPYLAGLLSAHVAPADALSRWGQRLLGEKRSSEAGAAFRSALAFAPEDALLWTNYGIALDQSGVLGEAVLCFERSLSLNHEQPDAWLLLGVLKTKLSDTAAAEAAYRAALELSPDFFVAHQLLGLLKQQQRDHAGAIACFKACIASGGATTSIWANLGKLYYQEGLIPEAYAAYAEASGSEPENLVYHQMSRRTRFLRRTLQGAAIDEALAEFRRSVPAHEPSTEKDEQDLLGTSFSFLSGFGHIDAAARVGRRLLERWPASPSLRYLVKAVTGDAGLDRSAPEYVVEHFDEFAEGFDAQLVGALGYDIPEKLCGAVRALIPPGKLQDILDAGCGTGLCGALLRPLAFTLSGVDLSPKMLEQAAKRGVYDTLAREELTVFLAQAQASFDVIVAADVLVYFGDLAPLFVAAANALKPGGLLACSTEWQANDGYRLQPSGRFAHAPSYVLAAAESAFEEVSCVETTIRLEARQRLLGNMFIFRRR